MNGLTIHFADGGFVLTVDTETDTKTSVFVSQGKLIKAVRTAIDELSLLPKKAEADEAAE
jgi:hypothetical protein